MSRNITIAGASYSDVPAILFPVTGGGTAAFSDVTDTTATAEDVASGKYFYTASGVRTEGTASGGGGGGIGTLLVEKHLGQVTCSSTSATSTGYTVSLSNLADYDMFISVIFCKAVNGRHVATVSVMWRQYNNNGTSRLDVGGTSLNYRMSSNVIYTGVGSSSVCGVYPATKTNIGGATTTTVNITAKYQGSTTQTIDGDYTARIYGVKLPNFLS